VGVTSRLAFTAPEDMQYTVAGCKALSVGIRASDTQVRIASTKKEISKNK